MKRYRRKVKHRLYKSIFINPKILELSDDDLFFTLKNSTHLFTEYKRQQKLLLKKDLIEAKQRFLQLFVDIDIPLLCYEVRHILSSFHLITYKDKDSYKNLHRELLLIIKKSKKSLSFPIIKTNDFFSLQEILERRTPLQTRILYTLFQIMQGKKISSLHIKINKEDIPNYSLKKFAKLIKQSL